MACDSFEEAQHIYSAHGSQFNAIHVSAYFTALARLARPQLAARPSAGNPVVMAVPGQSHRSPRRPLTAAEGQELRRFVSDELLPTVGLKLMGMGPRQLASVLAALVHLECPPPAFWMAEWLQHFARRLDASALPPLFPLPATAEAGRRPSLPAPHRCGTGDMAQAMWAIARLQGRQGAPERARLGAAAPPSSEAAPAAAAAATAGSAAQAAPPRSGAAAASATICRGGGGGGGVASGAGPRPSASPSLVWMDNVARAFAAASPAASPADMSAYLWAAATLGYRPPLDAMAAILQSCAMLFPSGAGESANGAQQRQHERQSRLHPAGARDAGVRVGALGPRELSTVLWAVAVLGFNPGAEWLERASREVARLAGADPEAEAALPEGLQAQPEAGRRGGHQGIGAGEMPSAAEAAAATGSAAVSCVGAVAAGGAAGGAAHNNVGQAPPTPSDTAAPLQEEPWWEHHFSGCPAQSAAVAAIVSTPTGALPAPASATAPRPVGRPVLLDSRRAATCAWALAKLGHKPAPGTQHALIRAVCAPCTRQTPEAAFLAESPAAGRRAGGHTHTHAPSSPPPPPPTSAAGGTQGPGTAWGHLHHHLAHRQVVSSPQDFSMLAHALGTLRFRPEPSHVLRLLAAMASGMDGASGQDLVLWPRALQRLHLAVPVPWVSALLEVSSWHWPRLPPLALVNFVVALSGLRTAEPGWWRRERARRRMALQAQRRQAAAWRQRRQVPDSSGGGGGGVEGSGSAGAGGERPRALGPEGWLRRAGGDDARAWVVCPLRSLRSPTFDGTHPALGVQPQQQLLLPCPQEYRSSNNNNSRSALALGRLPHPGVPRRHHDGQASGGADGAAAAAAHEQPEHTVVVRRASRALRSRLFLWLLRITAARLPALTLEHQCRLAWGVAQLSGVAPRFWVDRVVLATMQGLTRMVEAQLATRGSLHLLRPTRQAEERPAAGGDQGAATSRPAEWAAAAATPPTAPHTAAMVLATTGGGLADRGLGFTATPTVPAAYLVTLVKAVSRLLQRLRPYARHPVRRVRLSWRKQQRNHRASPRSSLQAARARSHVPRRWFALVLIAVLPQIHSLSNAQILDLVQGLVQIRGGPPRLPLAAALRSYCRRRVAATCGGGRDDGGEEACDLTTAGLLHWTSGWDAGAEVPGEAGAPEAA